MRTRQLKDKEVTYAKIKISVIKERYKSGNSIRQEEIMYCATIDSGTHLTSFSALTLAQLMIRVSDEISN